MPPRHLEIYDPNTEEVIVRSEVPMSDGLGMRQLFTRRLATIEEIARLSPIPGTEIEVELLSTEEPNPQ